MPYQNVNMKRPSRKDHVWIKYDECFKCCLCGAVSKRVPPNCPTPSDWMPDTYEPLTEQERALVPELRLVGR